MSRTFYDAASRVVKVQSGIGTDWVRDDVTSTYTPNGRLATVTDAEANRTTYEYDLFDRLAKTRYPSKTIPNQSSTLDFELLAYDAGSRVTSRTLRDETVIAFGYDDLDRLVLKDLPGTETNVTYAYDWLNRMTTAAQGNVQFRGHYT
ncbi:hypothetical protein ACFQRC_03610 [Enterovirga sp. GCM10030262]|uniref:hypothetical protein n=1 Tax=Enterovirga sp. GCM10030262 TaxID=3273391 RepID=UPI00361CDF5B